MDPSLEVYKVFSGISGFGTGGKWQNVFMLKVPRGYVSIP